MSWQRRARAQPLPRHHPSAPHPQKCLSQHCRLASRGPPRPLAPFPACRSGKKPGGRSLGVLR